MGRIIENNQVRISGEMTSDFGFSHEVFGEGFYTAQITIRRESGQKDRILVMASERLVDVKRKWIGQFAEVSGQIRSYDRYEGERNHLELLIFASKMKKRDMGGKRSDPMKTKYFLRDMFVRCLFTARHQWAGKLQICCWRYGCLMVSRCMFRAFAGGETHVMRKALSQVSLFRRGEEYKAGITRRRFLIRNMKQEWPMKYRSAAFRRIFRTNLSLIYTEIMLSLY